MQQKTKVDGAIAALRLNGDDLSSQRAIGLLTVLKGSKIDVQSTSLLSDMIAERDASPCVDAYLTHVVPGLESDLPDPCVAKRFLKQLTATIVASSEPLKAAA